MKKLCFFFLMVFISGALIAQSYDNPEGAIYDHVNDQYLISNSGSGSILAADPGTYDLSNYISSGLNTPKGMCISGDNLYVADGNQVHIIDLNSSSISQSVTFSNAQELADATANNDSVFITDVQADLIFYMSTNGSDTSILSNSWSLNKPNGILLDANNKLLVVSFKSNAPFQIINRDDGTVDETGTGIDNFFGLTQSANGDYYLSAWHQGAVYTFTDVNSPPLYHDNANIAVSGAICNEPSFIYFCDQNDLLIVPCGSDDEVHFFDAATLGIDNHSKERIVASPNPGAKTVNIRIPERYINPENYADVYSLQGNHIKRFKLDRSQIRIKGLPAASYIVKFELGTETQTQKIIITE